MNYYRSAHKSARRLRPGGSRFQSFLTASASFPATSCASTEEGACPSRRMTEMPSIRSKDQFQRKLDFSVGAARFINRARAANRRPGLIEECLVVDGGLKVRMIEHIEKLGAELQVQVLLDSIVLEHRKIEVYLARPVDVIAPRIAEKVRAGAHCDWIRRAAGLERHTLRRDRG